jgi:hypothetical protein
MRSDDTALESVEHRGRLNAALVRISAIRHALQCRHVGVASYDLVHNVSSAADAANYALEMLTRRWRRSPRGG